MTWVSSILDTRSVCPSSSAFLYFGRCFSVFCLATRTFISTSTMHEVRFFSSPFLVISALFDGLEVCGRILPEVRFATARVLAVRSYMQLTAKPLDTLEANRVPKSLEILIKNLCAFARGILLRFIA